jgi:chromate transporter
MNALALYWLLLQSVAVSFSGFASVPLIRESLVTKHAVLTDAQVNDAIAISQASPGPLGLYVVNVGYFAGGVPGAIAGMLALATPAVLVVPIAAAVTRGRTDVLRRAASGIVLASCALMLTAGVRLAPDAVPDMRYALIAVVCFVVLATSRVQPVWVILGATVMSLLPG